MALANAEGSKIDFPGLPGIFDVKYPLQTTGWTGYLPFSGVMAEAIQTIAVTSKNAAVNLLAVGYRGNAGLSKRFGGVDVSIDAVLTNNVLISGATGYSLQNFENILPSGLTIWTTNGSVGKKVIVTGLYVNSIMMDFKQNDNSSMTWTFGGNGVTYENYSVAASGIIGETDYHCVDPLTWDEVNIFDGSNNIVLTGVQNCTFTSTLSRTDVYQIGQFTPFDRAVQHPYQVSVTMNTLADEVNLVNWWQNFVPAYDPALNCNNNLVIEVRTGSIGGANPKIIAYASGLRPTTSTLNTAVGANSTVALTWEGTSFFF